MRYLCKMYHVYKVPIGTRHTKDNVEVVVRDCPDVKLFYTDVDRVRLIVNFCRKQNTDRARDDFWQHLYHFLRVVAGFRIDPLHFLAGCRKKRIHPGTPQSPWPHPNSDDGLE